MKALHEAGCTIRISFDDRALCVHENVFAASSYLMPKWTQVAAYDKADDWYSSPYLKRVTNEETRDLIDWFWLDLGQVGG